ncbi:MAG: helix-turn-helix domain-containing protein [Leptospira sp.]|nr:helix-turn-helix domain-containing protein [Leptospira sp.]
MDSGTQPVYLLLPLAAFHTLFCIAFLVFKKNRNLHDMIGGFWLILTCLACIRRAMHLSPGPMNPEWFMRIIAYPLIHGPFLYIYTRNLVHNEKKIHSTDAIHFIPFLFFTLIFLFPQFESEKFRMDGSWPGAFHFYFLFGISIPVSLAFYCVLSLRLLKKHSKLVPEYFSNRDIGNTLIWLNVICWIYFGVIVTQIPLKAGVLIGILIPLSPVIFNALSIGYLYILSFFILRQKAVFTNEKIAEDETPVQEKYQKSRLEQERVHGIKINLLEYMKTQRPYLKDDLGIQEIATHLSVSTNHLSQVLNLELKKNFYSFINEYRVEEVKIRLLDPAYSEYPVMRIALDCGFSSKSSFHAIFLKITGQSPGDFKRR